MSDFTDDMRPAPAGGAVIVDDLRKIDGVIREMWRVAEENSAAAEGAGKPLVRLNLSSLVAVVDEARAAAAEEVINRFTARRPSRVILARWLESAEGREIRASILPVCHIPRFGGPKVCCEYIHLEMGDEGAALLPGVIAPLLDPDLPNLIWWDRAFDEDAAALDRLKRIVRNLLVDSERPGVFSAALRLRRERAYELHDFAWSRIENWRRATAQAFDDPPALEMLREARRVRARCRAPRRPEDERGAPPAAGALYIGWLAGQMRWSVERPFEVVGEGEYRATARDQGRLIEIEISVDPQPCEPGVPSCPFDIIEIESGETEIKLRRGAETDKIIITFQSPLSCPLRRHVGLATPRADVALAAALDSATGADPVYLRALDSAMAFMGQ